MAMRSEEEVFTGAIQALRGQGAWVLVRSNGEHVVYGPDGRRSGVLSVEGLQVFITEEAS